MSKAPYKRVTRVADQILAEVADILVRKTKDPRVGLVTVTGVEVTDDLRLARVYVSMLRDEAREAITLGVLDKATGFVRAELGRRLHLRYTPEVVFLKDQGRARGERVLELLRSLERKEDLSGNEKLVQ